MKAKISLLLLLLTLKPGAGLAAKGDQLWTPDDPKTPILRNHPSAHTQVCKYRSDDGFCYRLWLNDPAEPNIHLPIPWAKREDFGTLLDKLERMEAGGYCLLYEGKEWSGWTGQGRASTKCGELRHQTEMSTCLVPATACDDTTTCQLNSHRTRSGRSRNASCGVVEVDRENTLIAEKTSAVEPPPSNPTAHDVEDEATEDEATEEMSPVGFPICGLLVPDFHRSTDESSPALDAGQCHWQPGMLISRIYAPHRGIGLRPYPWGALTGACSPFDDASPRYYYENRGSLIHRIDTELLLYIQMCG